MNWVIETGIETEEATRLVTSAKKLGYKTYTPSFLPFGAVFGTDRIPLKEKSFFHGSLQACDHVFHNIPDWKVFYDPAKYKCSYYYPRMEGYLWNEECVFLPIGMIEYRKDFLFRKMGVMGSIFVRPDSPNKEFTGMLLNLNTFESDLRLLKFYQNPVETMAVVASPATCYNEIRFFVKEGEVITGSYYIKDKQNFKEEVGETSEEMYIAQNLLNKTIQIGFTPPDKIWVMDICCGKEGKYFILEIGPFSGSGLYMANTDAIIKCIK